MDLKLEHTFDPKTYRHQLNGIQTVLHCHHYMTLYHKLAEAEDSGLNGTAILRESAEDALRPLFDKYFSDNSVASPEERLAVGTAYYSVLGMGKMEAQGSENEGQVILRASHVDQGWIQKWGKREKHINHFTCGYIAALFAATFNKPPRSYKVVEIESIVTGAPQSMFTVTLG